MKKHKNCWKCRALEIRYLGGNVRFYTCNLRYQIEEIKENFIYVPYPKEPCPKPVTYKQLDNCENKS